MKYTHLKCDGVTDLKWAVVPEAPNTRCHRDGWDKKQRHKDQQPEVFPSLHTVTHQNLERQEEEMDPNSDQHGLKFYTGFTLSPENHTHMNGK